jgi:hypothetical protein
MGPPGLESRTRGLRGLPRDRGNTMMRRRLQSSSAIAAALPASQNVPAGWQLISPAGEAGRPDQSPGAVLFAFVTATGDALALVVER